MQSAETVETVHFLVHTHRDNVGVVVVEDVASGTPMRGVVTADDSTLELTAGDDVPIGHKIALADLAEGQTVIKYGEDMGRIVAPVAAGHHVHTHNCKTKRW